MTATRAGVFEALADGPLTSQEVAGRCGTDEYATAKLLFALAGARYLRLHGGRYRLAPVARRWLLARSRPSLRDAVLHRYLDAALMEHYDAFLRSGRPSDYHQTMSEQQWELYERGQRSHAALAAWEVALRAPLPSGASAMLDIGGGHGYYSVALCRRHAGLRSTILDLPAALAQAAPLLEREGMAGRIVQRAGNALTDDLGDRAYDLVLIANVAHHFTAAQNQELMRRVARALRPGGACVVVELIRAATPGAAGQVAALTDFYFAATSEAGTWSFAEIQGWQRAAGLTTRRPLRLLSSPGLGLQAARRTWP